MSATTAGGCRLTRFHPASAHGATLPLQRWSTHSLKPRAIEIDVKIRACDQCKKPLIPEQAVVENVILLSGRDMMLTRLSRPEAQKELPEELAFCDSVCWAGWFHEHTPSASRSMEEQSDKEGD